MMSISEPDLLINTLKKVKKAGNFSDELIQSFADFIITAPEEELFRSSPLRYALISGLDQLTAITLFLHATHAGIFEFSWGTLCPSCGAFITSESGLRHIKSNQHCALCALPYAPDTDTRVEIAFTVSPKYRSIRFHDMQEIDLKDDWIMVMFSSSIAHSPEDHQILHSSLKGSYSIKPNHTELIDLELETNHYLFIVPASHATAHLSVKDKNNAHSADLQILPNGDFVPEMTFMAPGKAAISIHNQTSNSVMVGLHKDTRMAPFSDKDRVYPIQPLYTSTPYLTGKQLITNQTFRNLFEKESVPADEGLEFNNLTFLFTDLKGSTALYDRLGDIKAYNTINQHFDSLRETIAANNGAVVKTMGDAIMASFANPADAVIAACAMKGNVNALEGSDELEVRIGVHSGPSMAINTNEQLDFFGQTVNVASRVQHAAEPGQIVVTKETYDSPGVQDAIKAADLIIVEEQGEFKGVKGNMIFYRLE